MNYNLENKTVVITGGNAGIGRAAAVQLARLGATIILACRSAERGARVHGNDQQVYAATFLRALP